MTVASPNDFALLTPHEMARADAMAMAAGIAGERLMEAAGGAVASAVAARWSRRSVAVLCGPGNNGGDGFVAARRLAAAGWPVRLFLLGTREALKGDAARHAALWSGAVEPLPASLPPETALVIDAIFGAGLARPVDGVARQVLESLVPRRLPTVAVDVPSGVDGATGAVLGYAPACAVTVTFFRKKPGHLLFPGRALCGETIVADIGIPDAVLTTIAPRTFENAPAVWRHAVPWPRPDGHKYARGHALIAGGAVMTGAARLAARAAARSGAGLVTIAAPRESFAIYAAALAGTIVQPIDGLADFAALLGDARRNAILVGPGVGAVPATRDLVLAALATRRSVVLDADVFAVFAGKAAELAAAIAGPTLLTPHAGEFARLFGDVGDRLASARSAAAASGATMLLKGPDTVVASPDGWAVINANAPPELATAGSGDVLAGIATGLLAQGMSLPLAAAAAVWLHGEAAARFGPGLVAEDIIDALPPVLRDLKEERDEVTDPGESIA
ncbi:MAG: bifunctional ADP-dependent (S)-NAD(P)H-hydrate dehydratase/NAD(P)H-hydrate epimerase [Rhodospirillales bacterium]|nr:bifunctional ADP-dependent (S)-NAD(P)H-hydrate dehydratase/NAD(P)H-hydrate epimerase [Rhodospirillales bacterium]